MFVFGEKGSERMNKCVASQNGICRNVFGFGTECDGYSENCSLKPHYDNLQKIQENIRENIKNALRIKGDRE